MRLSIAVAATLAVTLGQTTKPADPATSAQSSRVRVLTGVSGSAALMVQVGTVTGGAGSFESVRLLLANTPLPDASKLKPVPETRVVEALVTQDALAVFTAALNQAAANKGTQVSVTGPNDRFGYAFERLPDAGGKPQPYAQASVFDLKGSVKGKAGAAPIGVAAAYPLELWKPDASGDVRLALPSSFTTIQGQLVVWRCVRDKALWVETLNWPVR